MDQEQFDTTLRRREALLALGGLGAGAVFGLHSLTAPADALGVESCLLQREVTEGPFYLDLDLVRRDITGDRRGTPLALRFTVVDATTCKPIRNATVDIWHADAAGAYSGVQGVSGTFLRGIQRTNAKGVARFESIFPGWYPGRAPHIHLKAFVSGDEVHTGQVFFREAVARSVYRRGVYASRGQPETVNTNDAIYGQAGPRAVCSLKRVSASGGGGYSGAMVIGVDRS